MKKRFNELWNNKKEGMAVIGVALILFATTVVVGAVMTRSVGNNKQTTGAKKEVEVYYGAEAGINIATEAIIAIAEYEVSQGTLEKNFKRIMDSRAVKNLFNAQGGRNDSENIAYNRMKDVHEIRKNKGDEKVIAEVSVKSLDNFDESKVLAEYEIRSTGLQDGQQRTLVSVVSFSREMMRKFVTDSAIIAFADEPDRIKGGEIKFDDKVTINSPIYSTRAKSRTAFKGDTHKVKTPGGKKAIMEQIEPGSLSLPEYTMPELPTKYDYTVEASKSKIERLKKGKNYELDLSDSKYDGKTIYIENMKKIKVEDSKFTINVGSNEITAVVDDFELDVDDGIVDIKGDGRFNLHVGGKLDIDSDEDKSRVGNAQQFLIYAHSNKGNKVEGEGGYFDLSIMGDFKLEMDKDDDIFGFSGFYIITGKKKVEIDEFNTNPGKPTLIFAPDSKIELEDVNFTGVVIGRKFDEIEDANITFDINAYNDCPFDLKVYGGNGEEVYTPANPDAKVRINVTKTIPTEAN